MLTFMRHLDYTTVNMAGQQLQVNLCRICVTSYALRTEQRHDQGNGPRSFEPSFLIHSGPSVLTVPKLFSQFFPALSSSGLISAHLSPFIVSVGATKRASCASLRRISHLYEWHSASTI